MMMMSLRAGVDESGELADGAALHEHEHEEHHVEGKTEVMVPSCK